ncbi:ornithine cyclodeaminase, partial [Pseudomonas putida]|nr:ornithine cyclodeaminase [Pseudomonas putida]
DIVTTVTADKTNATILTRAMVQPGMHLNAVGGDCPGKTELDAAILPEASVFVEFAPQSRIEGEIQHMAPDFAVTELWQVLHGKSP